MSYLTHLQCSHCNHTYDADQLIRLCPECGMPLLARYDLAKAAAELDREAINCRPATLWKFHELLPVRDPRHFISLGEGGTPVLKIDQLGQSLGLNQLYIKDE
ncbi:MAG: threonine synthase, partial [Anaerolineae bacterium]